MELEEYSRRPQALDGWAITVETYKLGAVYYCSVASVDPGARFAHARGSTRREAEREALEKAARFLAQTRRFSIG